MIARCSLVVAAERIEAGGPRHHLLQPGTRADMGQAATWLISGASIPS